MATDHHPKPDRATQPAKYTRTAAAACLAILAAISILTACRAKPQATVATTASPTPTPSNQTTAALPPPPTPHAKTPTTSGQTPQADTPANGHTLPYTLTLGAGWAPAADSLGQSTSVNHPPGPGTYAPTAHVHRNAGGEIDAHIHVMALPSHGLHLSTYLEVITATLEAHGMNIITATLLDDIRRDHTPIAYVEYAPVHSDQNPSVTRGQQATLLSPDGHHLIIATYAASASTSAEALLAIVANIEVPPAEPFRGRRTLHHSSDVPSPSPTMRKLR